MDDEVKAQPAGKRVYHSPRRLEQAAATRHAVLAAARELFVANGYSSATVAEIAERARVSVDTVPAEQRDYVIRISVAASAREKITIYANAITGIQERMAPVFLALRDAASTDRECAALWAEIAERRATNMRLFAADLRATGELREDLSDDQVADIIWSMNAAEYWDLLVRQRAWTPDQFAAWLIDAWTRLLLT
jgi:hypothetical protein